MIKQEIKLTENQVIQMHSSLIGATKGLNGVRDEGLLKLSLDSPYQTFGGMVLYSELLAKAARLCFSLVSNHPFADGNKRIGVHAMLVYLTLNGIKITYTQEELVNIGLSLASGTMRFEELHAWLTNHCV